jgi:transposase
VVFFVTVLRRPVRSSYALWYKRLEQGTFRVPPVKPGRESVELRASELAMLLDGIDLRSLRRVERYTR